MDLQYINYQRSLNEMYGKPGAQLKSAVQDVHFIKALRVCLFMCTLDR